MYGSDVDPGPVLHGAPDDGTALSPERAPEAADIGFEKTAPAAPRLFVGPTLGAGARPEEAGPSATDHLEVVDPEHYAIEGEFARGGLGRILDAFDRRLERRVAVKELLVGAGEHAEARFVREARLTARLQHPSIVPVHEAGRWPSGKIFYSMKLVRGRTLRDEIKKASTLRERLALLPNVIAVAEAIAYAHTEGIIHRDIKPSNVLVGAFGETVVIDWGLAKDLRSHSAEWPPLEAARVDGYVAGQTATGTVLGTPEYMSPEQAIGSAVDERADVYAIGALLYHLLSGNPPFARDSMEQVLERVIQGPPLPIEVRQPDVPEELATIVKKAMARDPAQRYPTARELATDLRSFQTGKMIAAHQYTFWTLLLRWLRRYRAVVSVATVSLLVVAVVAALSVDRVINERNHAQKERAIAEARTQELTLVQARTSLERDPTAALAWLKTYPLSGPDEGTLRTIAADAWARGIARHVLRLDDKAEEGAVSPDGRWLAASNPNAIYLWEMASGRRVMRFERRATNRLRFTRDGRTLISVGNDGRIILHAVPPTLAAPDRTLLGHQGAVRGFDLAPDGSAFASSGADGTVRVWDVAAGTSRILGRHAGGAPDAVFSPDGRQVASVGTDNQVRLWSVDGASSRRLSGCAEKVPLRVRFSPDGRRLAVSGASGAVVLYDLGARGGCRVVARHTGMVIDLAFAHDGRHLASSGADGQIALVSLDGRGLRWLRGHSDQVLSISFSPDDSLLASSGLDSTIRVYDVASGEARPLLGHVGIVNRVVFADARPGDRRPVLTSMGHDYTVRVWDLSDPGPRILRGHESDVNGVEFSADGRLLATTSEDRNVRVWSLDSGASRVLKGHHDGVYRAFFSGDLGQLVSTSWDHDIRVWDLATGTSRVLVGHSNIAWRASFTPEGDAIISASRDGTIRRWTLSDGGARILARHQGAVRGIAESPDRRRFATSGEDGLVQVVTLDGVERWSWQGHDGSIERLAYAPDGLSLAAGGVDGTIRIFDQPLEPGSGTLGEPRVFAALGEPIRGLSFSPNGRELAISTGDRVHVFQVATGAVRVLRGHEGAIRHLHFSPDGELLVSLAADRTVRVFDLAHEGRLRTLFRTPSHLLHGVISPDGQLFAAGGWDRVVRIWPLRPLVLPDSREELMGWLQVATSAVVGDAHQLGTP